MPCFDVVFIWTEVHEDSVAIEADSRDEAAKIAGELLAKNELQGNGDTSDTWRAFNDFDIEEVHEIEEEPEYYLYRNEKGKIRRGKDKENSEYLRGVGS